MNSVYDVVVLMHILGLAALIGGYFSLLWALPRTSNPAFVPSVVMLWGARAQIVTGIILVGIAEVGLDAEINHAKIGTKLLVSLVVAGLVESAAAKGRRGESFAPGMVHAAGGLAIFNATVAVLWT
ncbi:MAG: hypothetical protein WBG57_04635 [Ornithinimicrobium sp.]